MQLENSFSLTDDQRSRLIKFNELLNLEPPKQHIKIASQQKGGRPYLPISYVEMELDGIYNGCWKTENFVVVPVQSSNKVLASIDLWVLHPILGIWIKRTGGADISAKMANNASILKAECIKNAAKSLGKRFGRDIARDSNMTADGYEAALISEDGINKVSDLLEASGVTEAKDLAQWVHNNHPEWLRDAGKIDLINDTFRKLKMQAKNG